MPSDARMTAHRTPIKIEKIIQIWYHSQASISTRTQWRRCTRSPLNFWTLWGVRSTTEQKKKKNVYAHRSFEACFTIRDFSSKYFSMQALQQTFNTSCNTINALKKSIRLRRKLAKKNSITINNLTVGETIINSLQMNLKHPCESDTRL